MGKSDLTLFLNKTVRLVKSDGFVLTGKILKINDDDLLFETKQATSLISKDRVKEIVLKKRGIVIKEVYGK